MKSARGNHEYTRGCSVHCSFQVNSVVFSMTFPTLIMLSPSVLMILMALETNKEYITSKWRYCKSVDSINLKEHD